MNSFAMQIKENGAWTNISAISVFPFSWGNLLDERLDEAHITIYDYPSKEIKPTTEIRAVINNNGTEYIKSFIVAGDNSEEYPNGSGKYKHELYLIEPMKLTEGILCSSLTFTNARPFNIARYQEMIARGGVALGETANNNIVTNEAMVTQYCEDSKIKYFYPYGKPFAVTPTISFLTWYNQTFESDYTLLEGTMELQAWTGDIVANGFANSTQIAIDTDGNIPTENLEKFSIRYKYSVKDRTTEELKKVAYVIVYCTYEEVEAKKNNTITDVVNRTLEQAEPLMATETPRFQFDGVSYAGSPVHSKEYTAGSQAEYYDKMSAPEFTMTQCTLREQLRVVGGFIHGEPYIDANGKVKYKPLAATRRWYKGENLAYAKETATRHINEYCTEVRSNARNLVSSLNFAKGVMVDPGRNLLRSLRSEELYVRVNATNGIAETAERIQEVIKIECGLYDIDVPNRFYIEPKDITAYLYEQTQYNANLSNYKEYPFSKPYAIYYTQGQKNIGGLFYKDDVALDFGTYPCAIANILAEVSNHTPAEIQGVLTRFIINDKKADGANGLVFRITYKPISDHFVSHGKQIYIKGETPYTQIYNQGENLVESSYFGENLKGVAARLGNIQQERTYILQSLEDIPDTGMLLGKNAITAVYVELMPYFIKCTVGLSLDFQNISEYVGINSIKRMYDISERNVYTREILLKNRIVITDKGIPEGYNTSNCMLRDLRAFGDAFRTKVSDYVSKISFATFTWYNKRKVANTTTLVPVISRSLGNSVVFTFAMADNYSAGNKKTELNSGNLQGYWLDGVRYTDDFGNIAWSELTLGCQALGSNSKYLIKQSNLLPQKGAETIFSSLEVTPRINNNMHYLDKDNREAITYNLEFEFVTDAENVVIGSALASFCSYVNDDKKEAPKLYVYDRSLYPFYKFDRIFTPVKGETTRDNSGISDVTITNGANGTFSITITPALNDQLPNLTADNAGWVIAYPRKTTTRDVFDEDGNKITETVYSGGEVLLSGFGIGPKTFTFYITK